MGTVNVEQTGGQSRRPLDQEINLIPMIDLLLCCVSFLLITAVWSQLSRVELSPDKFAGGDRPPAGGDKVLHVDMRGDQHFTLSWKTGPTTVSTDEVIRQAVMVGDGDSKALSFPGLADQMTKEWQSHGTHVNPGDSQFDRAVLHTDANTPFEQVIAVIDAVHRPKREKVGTGGPVPVFQVTLATD
jgi:biopolymer transport protein ExbD